MPCGPRPPPRPLASAGLAYGGASAVREAPPVYRPRHPERSALYQLLERHGETYKRHAEERFGRLRPAAVRAMDAFLECGRLQNGFARIRCAHCRAEHLLAFSCRVRNLCPSCQMKRALLLAFRLVDDLLLPAPHAHVVFTIPRRLREVCEKDRSLLGLLVRTAWRALADELEAGAPPDARAAMVASIQTFGETANWNPHIHALALCGVVRPGGEVIAQRIDAGREHLFSFIRVRRGRPLGRPLARGGLGPPASIRVCAQTRM